MGQVSATETYAETWGWGSLKGFATIDYADSLGGYEWDEFHVLRGMDGYLYVGEDGGCSCKSFSDVDPKSFVKVASWQEAAAKAQEWAKAEGYWSEERRLPVAMNLIERLSQKRPAPFVEIDARNPFGGAA